MSCLLTVTLHIVDVRLTCLINITYLFSNANDDRRYKNAFHSPAGDVQYDVAVKRYCHDTIAANCAARPLKFTKELTGNRKYYEGSP